VLAEKHTGQVSVTLAGHTEFAVEEGTELAARIVKHDHEMLFEHFLESPAEVFMERMHLAVSPTGLHVSHR